jgi:hypothetical protein
MAFGLVENVREAILGRRAVFEGRRRCFSGVHFVMAFLMAFLKIAKWQKATVRK